MTLKRSERSFDLGNFYSLIVFSPLVVIVGDSHFPSLFRSVQRRSIHRNISHFNHDGGLSSRFRQSSKVGNIYGFCFNLDPFGDFSLVDSRKYQSLIVFNNYLDYFPEVYIVDKLQENSSGKKNVLCPIVVFFLSYPLLMKWHCASFFRMGTTANRKLLRRKADRI